MVDLAGHLLVFTVLGIVFLLGPLILGRFFRPKNPTVEKDSAYECGEPSIGSAFIQFDLRYYVVALLFIIFDVEVAFFFPWAAIYGGSAQLADPNLTVDSRQYLSAKLLNQTQDAISTTVSISADTAARLLDAGLIDLLVFFGVLMVGFAYVWKRGDLDWVRAMTAQSKLQAPSPLQGATRNPDAHRELQALH